MEHATMRSGESRGKYREGDGLDSVGQYMKEIGKIALLDADEEVELAQAIEAGLYAQQLVDASGDEEHIYRDRWEQLDAEYQDLRSLRLAAELGERAWTQMIESNTRLVTSIARRFTDRGLSLQDLIQEGNLGLIHAVEKFDYTKGFKFSTYATHWIDRYIRIGLNNHARTIRLPIWVGDQANKMNGAIRAIENDPVVELTLPEIAKRAGLEEERVRELQDYTRTPVSLDQRIGKDEDAVLGDIIADITDIPVEDIATHLDTRRYLQEKIPLILEDLAKTHREYSDILRLYFGIGGEKPKTMQEIGERYGKSYQNMQIKMKRALAILRKSADVRELEELLS